LFWNASYGIALALPRFMRSLLLLTATLPLAACASSPGHVTDPGESIYTSDVRKLVIENRGGGLLPPPPSSTACNPQRATYTLNVAGHQFNWQYCEVTGSGSTATYTPRTGSRALQAAEWSALQPKLDALIVSGRMDCGADKPEYALTVTTSAGDLEYGDDFYACQDRSRPYIVSDALGGALGALGALARP
jgi:hypothetical protein